jgi:hypothetical protein
MTLLSKICYYIFLKYLTSSADCKCDCDPTWEGTGCDQDEVLSLRDAAKATSGKLKIEIFKSKFCGDWRKLGM